MGNIWSESLDREIASCLAAEKISPWELVARECPRGQNAEMHQNGTYIHVMTLSGMICIQSEAIVHSRTRWTSSPVQQHAAVREPAHPKSEEPERCHHP